jgi:hypothetical protein
VARNRSFNSHEACGIALTPCLISLRSNPSPDATPRKSKEQIESEFTTQAEIQAAETPKRVKIN